MRKIALSYIELTRFGAPAPPPYCQTLRRAKSRQAVNHSDVPLMVIMYSIDDCGLKTLTLLQANDRLINQELNDPISLSVSQCLRRRIALEWVQLIFGYHARLAPDAVGQEMLGLIEVCLLNHALQCMENFHRMLSEVGTIPDAWKTTGDAGYPLRVTVPDLPGPSHLINHTLAQNKGVTRLKTTMILSRLKENGQLMPDSDLLR